MKNIINNKESLETSVNEVIETYVQFYTELKEDLAEGLPSELMTKEFYEMLLGFFESDLIFEYTPLRFNWLNQIDQYITVLQIHEDIQNCSPKEFPELEEEVFNFWNSNEYSYLFKDFLDEEDDIVASSFSLLRFVENHLLGFYLWHFADETNGKDSYTLHACEEIGDNSRYLTLGENGQGVELPNTFENYPIISFRQKNKTKVTLLDKDNRKVELEIKLINKKIAYLDSEFNIVPNKDFDDESKKIVSNINRALEIISKSSPELFERLKAFTHTFIPVKQEGIVSYSLQTLPGYSSINFFHRDFVDLIDDLLHENGHHILNSFLNHQDLINEDEDMIYWSPWRGSLRPIRGIYHAYLTFYWAHELFESLIKNEKNLDLNEKEISKVKRRFVEEHYMLTFCHSFIEHAYKNKKITDEGMKLIKPVMNKLGESKTLLKEIDPKIIESLSEKFAELEQKKTEYAL